MSLRSRLNKLEQLRPPPTRFVGSGRFWDAISGATNELTDEELAEFAAFALEAGVGPDGPVPNNPQARLDAMERLAADDPALARTAGAFAGPHSN